MRVYERHHELDGGNRAVFGCLRIEFAFAFRVDCGYRLLRHRSVILLAALEKWTLAPPCDGCGQARRLKICATGEDA